MDQTKDDLSDSGIGTTPRLKDIEANKDTIVEMKGKPGLREHIGGTTLDCIIWSLPMTHWLTHNRVQHLVWVQPH